jgi:Fe-S oxidoreductase
VLGALPPGNGFLLVEFGGDTRQDAESRARRMLDEIRKSPRPPAAKVFDDAEEERKVWRVREAGLGATAHVERDRPTWEGWEDSAVPPERLGQYLRAFRKLLDEHHLHGDLYGHFGQGCLHTRIDFDLETMEGIRQYRAFVEAAADLVVSLGGSLSGEHGDGQSRGELLSKMYGPGLMAAFHEFKRIWDPAGKMNPGKILDAYWLDENLRLGAHYDPPRSPTHFHYANEDGSFAKATLRCVGVGECRKLSGGTMCPSFRATREEMHSTRGRARLLFEMLQGHPLEGGWQNDHVKEALDLCLACKGCKHECPVGVDMATYKAEFLSHYYERHRRPASAYAFGLIHRWARVASILPGMANLVTNGRASRGLAKRLSGMAPARTIPKFARETFQHWYWRRVRTGDGRRPRVILWPDTFNNHIHTGTAVAALNVLEHAGFDVEVPSGRLCCGRPLYDYGWLPQARSLLVEVLRALRPAIQAGTPVVGLEPSCVSVFRHEMTDLLPGDEDAKRLARQTFTLSEFIDRYAPDFHVPALDRRALVHGHCHQKAIMHMDADVKLLDAIGLDYQLLDSGCCGMAGSFGFERQHYDISMKIGELTLLPAVRAASADTLIIADGFSCREQIAQSTTRRALHLAEVLQACIPGTDCRLSDDYPERAAASR